MFSVPNFEKDNLWRLSPEKFNEWRIENDFPRIMEFFKERLNGFSKWLKEYNLTDKEVINKGITSFILPAKIKYYIATIDSEEKISSHISYTHAKIGHKYETIPGHHFQVIDIKPFVPYDSWVKKNNIIIHQRAVKNTICITRKEAYRDPDYCKIFILDELELLKLGGYASQIFRYDMGWRYLGFVNLDHLNFLNCDLGSKESFISYSSCSYWRVDESSLHFFRFDEVDFEGMEVNNSQLDSWGLFNCKGYDTKIKNTIITRSTLGPGEFNPYFDNVDLRDSRLSSNYLKDKESGYSPNIDLIRKFKISFSSHGQHSVAGEYYYYEKCTQRKKDFRELLFHLGRFFSPINLFGRETNDIKLRFHHLSKLVKLLQSYLLGLLSWVWWGYGEKPSRVLFISLLTVLFGCLLISVFHPFINYSFGDAVYYSIISFLTVGDPEFKPLGFTRIIVSVLALLGILNLGLLISGFANKSKY